MRANNLMEPYRVYRGVPIYPGSMVAPGPICIVGHGYYRTVSIGAFAVPRSGVASFPSWRVFSVGVRSNFQITLLSICQRSVSQIHERLYATAIPSRCHFLFACISVVKYKAVRRPELITSSPSLARTRCLSSPRKADKMHVSQILPLFASLAAALTIQQRQSLPSGVQLAEVTYVGAGCPSNATAKTTPTALAVATTLPIPKVIYRASSGAENTRVALNVQSCSTQIKLTHPAGWQFSVTKADYYGRVTLPAGTEAISKSTYGFAGSSATVLTPQVFNLVRY